MIWQQNPSYCILVRHFWFNSFQKKTCDLGIHQQNGQFEVWIFFHVFVVCCCCCCCCCCCFFLGHNCLYHKQLTRPAIGSFFRSWLRVRTSVSTVEEWWHQGLPVKAALKFQEESLNHPLHTRKLRVAIKISWQPIFVRVNPISCYFPGSWSSCVFQLSIYITSRVASLLCVGSKALPHPKDFARQHGSLLHPNFGVTMQKIFQTTT